MENSMLPEDFRAVPRFVEDHAPEPIESYVMPEEAPPVPDDIAETFSSDEESVSATELMNKAAVDMYERRDREQELVSAQEIKLDGSNKVNFPEFPYTFEALGEKILVSIDIFKSGYECKTCHGKRTIEVMCPCEKTDRPGFKYDEAAIGEAVRSLGEQIATSRAAMSCAICEGHWQDAHKTVPCQDCKGIGHTIIIPDANKNRPTTGVVVSMGKKARELCTEYKVGDRILFGAYAGTMIPTKSGLAFKYLDWYQAVVKIEGADDLAAFDFILNE